MWAVQLVSDVTEHYENRTPRLRTRVEVAHRYIELDVEGVRVLVQVIVAGPSYGLTADPIYNHIRVTKNNSGRGGRFKTFSEAHATYRNLKVLAALRYVVNLYALETVFEAA
jgi:hypothetical protein